MEAAYLRFVTLLAFGGSDFLSSFSALYLLIISILRLKTVQKKCSKNNKKWTVNVQDIEQLSILKWILCSTTLTHQPCRFQATK